MTDRNTYLISVCEVGFYPLKEFLEHCEKDHREPHERIIIEKHLHVLDEAFKVNAYGMFQCLYCIHGCHKECKNLFLNFYRYF